MVFVPNTNNVQIKLKKRVLHNVKFAFYHILYRLTLSPLIFGFYYFTSINYNQIIKVVHKMTLGKDANQLNKYES